MVVVSDAYMLPTLLGWMAASVVAPYVALLVAPASHEHACVSKRRYPPHTEFGRSAIHPHLHLLFTASHLHMG